MPEVAADASATMVQPRVRLQMAQAMVADSAPLPTGGFINQADGTAWMAFYCGTMLNMALELAAGDPAYEDIATKFFERLAHAGPRHAGLWHLLGEIEVVFGFWAMVLMIAMFALLGSAPASAGAHHASISAPE